MPVRHRIFKCSPLTEEQLDEMAAKGWELVSEAAVGQHRHDKTWRTIFRRRELPTEAAPPETEAET